MPCTSWLHNPMASKRALGYVVGAEYITMSVPGVEKEQEEEKGPWLRVKPQDAMEQLLVAEGYTFVDIRWSSGKLCRGCSGIWVAYLCE